MNKNSTAYKVVLLSVVCAVAGLCLSAVNALTAPIIEKNALATVMTTLNQFFPDGEFEDVTSKYVTEDTDLVDGVYEAKGEGYVFTLHNTGYSSSGFKFAIGFNDDGTVAGYLGLEQNETKGKGSLAFEGSYVEDVKKLTSTDAMPLISGATVTTKAIGVAVTQAETIFNEIQGISFDPSNNTPAEPTPVPSASLKDTDFSKEAASCTDNGDGTYACKANGFAGELSATVKVENGAVVSITDLDGNDNGDDVGDNFFEDGGLSAYEGATLDTTIDVESGATFTSKAVQAMTAAALKSASGEVAEEPSKAEGPTLASEDYSSAKAECSDNGDGTYACKAEGFSKAEVSATVVVADGAVTEIKDLTGKDNGDGVGDDWYKDASNLTNVTLDSSVDAMSGATFTSDAVLGMVQAALNAAAK